MRLLVRNQAKLVWFAAMASTARLAGSGSDMVDRTALATGLRTPGDSAGTPPERGRRSVGGANAFCVRWQERVVDASVRHARRPRDLTGVNGGQADGQSHLLATVQCSSPLCARAEIPRMPASIAAE